MKNEKNMKTWKVKVWTTAKESKCLTHFAGENGINFKGKMNALVFLIK